MRLRLLPNSKVTLKRKRESRWKRGESKENKLGRYKKRKEIIRCCRITTNC